MKSNLVVAVLSGIGCDSTTSRHVSIAPAADTPPPQYQYQYQSSEAVQRFHPEVLSNDAVPAVQLVIAEQMAIMVAESK